VNIIIGKESQSLMHEHFGPYFKEIIRICEEKFPEKYNMEPICLAANMDGSARWKCTGRGGAAKNVTYPCECCTCSSLDLAKPQIQANCLWCRVLGHNEETNGVRCYHHKILTEERLDNMEVDLEMLECDQSEIQKDLDAIRSKSRFNVVENPRNPSPNSRTDVQSIHFDIESSKSWTDKGQFNRCLKHDLELRGLDGTTGSVRSRIECLRKVLIQE
jgi:hypothetical protein